MNVGNPDSWLKLLDVLQTRKTAAKLLIAAGLFLAVAGTGGIGILLPALNGEISRGALVAVVGVLSFALSVLIVDAITALWSTILRRRKLRLAATAERREAEQTRTAQQARVRLLFPQLAPENRQLLARLLKQPMSLLRDGLMRDLEQYGFVVREWTSTGTTRCMRRIRIPSRSSGICWPRSAARYLSDGYVRLWTPKGSSCRCS